MRRSFVPLLPVIRSSFHSFLFLLCAFGIQHSVLSATLRTQTIQLQQGWNAVFVEVEPADVDPAAVFAGAPVEIVATYFADNSPVQYLQDPDEQAWTDSGWSTWYAPGRDDAFLSKLHAIQANQPYLIKMSGAHTLNLEGTVKFRPMTWQPNSLNFVGFHVVASGAPTFEQFFENSASHAGGRAYKLVNGHWASVTNLAGEAIEAGKAYWVQCTTGSTYQGPLTVAIPYGDTLDFGEQLTSLTVTLTNTGADPIDITVEDLGQSLPLSYRTYDPDTGDTTYADLPASLATGTVEADQTYTLYLLVKREDFTQDEQSTVLKISTDSGVVIHLAVTAERVEQE